MSAAPPHVCVLGAGPAGVGAAFRLARRGQARVTVLERQRGVGGLAASFELAGMRVDYGSHRLHPSCDPQVLRDLAELLGHDLRLRPRHGRIRLHGRWIHFPLRPLDVVLGLPPRFAAGAAADALRKLLPGGRPRPQAESFATVLEAGLGRTICRHFYFPYARKVWGVEPEALAAVQARRRVRAGSLGGLARKVLSGLPGLRRRGTGSFYYPRQGYGQITEALYRAAEAAGARFLLGATVEAVEHEGGAVRRVRYEWDGESHVMEADHVWSTLPISALVARLRPAPAADLLAAASRLEFRAMILVYLVLEQDRFTEYDAHYFPEPEIPIARLSEPKNYSGVGPRGVTVLCAELPCAPTDACWRMSDDDLGRLVLLSLQRAGIPARAPVKEVVARRLPTVYPIYRSGYEEPFGTVDRYLDGLDRLVTFGRQGLFAHDNTHHALAMAYAAADCLAPDGTFDRHRWHGFRRVFETHVVED
jgi:protoporphyrinogen oxidase